MGKPDFSNLVKTIQPDLLIHDILQPWAGAIASLQNIPSVSFFTSGATMFSYFCHLEMHPGVKFPFPEIHLSKFELSMALGNMEAYKSEEKDPDDEAFWTNDGIILVNSSREIEGKYMDYLSGMINKKIIPIGALVQDPSNDVYDDSKMIMEWLRGKNEFSRVFVSFGSEYFLKKEEIEEITIGLELSNVNFIWIIRFPKGEEMRVEEALPKGFLERVGERGVILEKWAPQAKILSHSSVGGFVSHCGWNSLMESIDYGVPIIAMPMHLDQPMNAKLVVELGVGVEVRRDDNGRLQRDEISKVIRDVVIGKTGEELKRKVVEKRDSIRLRSREEVEEVAKKLAQLSCGVLFSFTYLEKLNLALNNFNNTQIPKGIQNLKYLSHLNLSNAGFGGQVPFELSLMKRLVSLDISSVFPGIQPLKVENPNLKLLLQNLTGLKELYLDGVDISAQGKEWCQLLLGGFFPGMIFRIPTLENLDLSNNELLSGSIPEFPQGSSLKTVVLSYTNFSGSLPDSLSNLSMLSKIDLTNSKFSGPIPSTLANLTELVNVDLSLNSFIGLIPPFYMSKKLTYTDLSRNSLTGSLSYLHFEGLSHLVYINFGYNLLNGSIPQSLLSLPSLQKLMLSNNQFSGKVEEFSTLHYSSGLYELDLSSNRLEGPIPESFFKLESLTILLLSYNNFNGTVHLEKIQRLRHLTKLELSYNNLSSFLDLSNNQITGEIPSWIWEIGNGALVQLNHSCNFLVDLQKPYQIPKNIAVLDLHSNQLRGELLLPPQAVYVDYSSNKFEKPIPLDFGYNVSFFVFSSLANNSLTGAIPLSLCNAGYLQVLDLSFNNLSGGIPPCLVQNIDSLGVLSLGRNNVSGDIPNKVSVNCGLKTLDLNNNNLVGKLPLSLEKCKSLEIMNVGNNNIVDSFPCMLSPSLRVLVLRSNRFHGELRCLKSWPNLQIVDIAYNNFSGHLYPESSSSWRAMMLNDDAELRRNHLRFKFLPLNNFFFQDEVTLTIKGLELKLVKILGDFASVDFSCNNFQGEIPDAIGDLSSLYLLNLSYNTLTGLIPKSFGNLTQLGSLDLSMNQLTGVIPMELAGLTFLSVLNLSYNKLFGQIPNGPQFQIPSASFEGNTGLCGFPANISCSITDENEDVSPPKLGHETEIEWDYISAALGYVVGLGSIIWLLLCCQSVRQKYFEHVDQVLVKIFYRQDRKQRRGGRVLRNQVRRQ
ncbi:hypothetical protein DH2020_028377 [Rehmannia glutinosa]|uniref:UDP-glycosyltransferases domain-containing protein n=1 Tax=Rehmannia glutinosa TaxID=99300 RepID=A0ABR0VV35_REHGL